MNSMSLSGPLNIWGARAGVSGWRGGCPVPPSPAPTCPLTLICLISYWIRLIGFPYISFPESTSFAETAFARITATERCRGQQGGRGPEVRLSPPIPQGLPRWRGAGCRCCPCCPQRTQPQTASRPQSWLSHTVPKGTGLWHRRDGNGQHHSSTLTAGDKERSPRDRPAPPPPALLDRLPSASAGSVSAQPRWIRGRRLALPGLVPVTQMAPGQLNPGSTAVFVPLSLIKPAESWCGQAGLEEHREHLGVTSGRRARPELTPGSPAPPGPRQPLHTPTPRERGSQGQAALAPHSRSTGSPCCRAMLWLPAPCQSSAAATRSPTPCRHSHRILPGPGTAGVPSCPRCPQKQRGDAGGWGRAKARRGEQR